MTPKKKDQVFPKQRAVPLLEIAKGDLHAAEVLTKTPGIRYETAGFYAQQAVEKAIKSVLIYLEMPVPLVHDAGILVAKLPDELCPPKGYDLSELTPFATRLRYLEGEPPFSKEDIEQVIAVARAVVEWAQKQMGQK